MLDYFQEMLMIMFLKKSKKTTWGEFTILFAQI